MKKLISLLMLPSLALWLVGSAAGDTIIYFDNFDGDGATLLHGSAPDTRPGSETWLATTTGAPGPGDMRADGTKNATGHRTAFLPFVPETGKIYTLSLDVNPTLSSSTDWMAVGFSTTNVVVNANSWHNNGNVLAAWMLNREIDSSSSAFQTFQGGGTTGTNTDKSVFNAGDYNPNPDKVGQVNMKIVLNTTSALWTAEWYVDNLSIRGPLAYATNPAIAYVGFGIADQADGSFDNFTLSAVPEPSTYAIGLLGIVGLLWCRVARFLASGKRSGCVWR